MNPDKKIRRLQSLLYTSGAGTILFSIWSAIRQIGIFQEAKKEFANMGLDDISIIAIRVIWVLVLVLILGLFFLYVYIGLQAMSVSLGKSKGSAYMIWAFLLILLSLLSYGHDLTALKISEWLRVDNVLTVVIDITANIILGEVIVFSILLKKMRD